MESILARPVICHPRDEANATKKTVYPQSGEHQSHGNNHTWTIVFFTGFTDRMAPSCLTPFTKDKGPATERPDQQPGKPRRRQPGAVSGQ